MRHLRRPQGTAGLTLVELLVATCVAAIALAAAWPWLWNTAGATAAVGERAQAATAGAYAVRTIADDLAQAVALLPPASGRSPGATLTLLHHHPGEIPETVTIVWDASRRVLWRKTSGTYLADQVLAFAVRYFASDGTELSGDDFLAPDWPARVARVAVEVRTARGGREVTSVLQACLGPA
jgi:type II secretory pathway component PulJ